MTLFQFKNYHELYTQNSSIRNRVTKFLFVHLSDCARNEYVIFSTFKVFFEKNFADVLKMLTIWDLWILLCIRPVAAQGKKCKLSRTSNFEKGYREQKVA